MATLIHVPDGVSRWGFGLQSFLVGGLLAVGLASLAAADDPGIARSAAGKRVAERVEEEPWVIEIRPQNFEAENAVATPAPAASAPTTNGPAPLVPRMTYAQALASIPFNRAEYEANPSYRHDSAMELMYGTLRPTTVIRQTIPYFSRYPDFFRNRFQIFPYPQNQNPSLNMFSQWNMSTFSY